MADATIGVSGYFLMTWRYNTAKQHGLYEPKTVRYLAYTSPPETKLLVNLMDKHYSTPYSRSVTYGELFDRVCENINK
jgi:hypothetical protein